MMKSRYYRHFIKAVLAALMIFAYGVYADGDSALCDGCLVGDNISCDLDGVKAARSGKYYLTLDDMVAGKSADVCQFSDRHCTPSSTFNFYKLYFCDLEGPLGQTGGNVTFIIIGSILIFIFMYNLASTADEYLSPALEHIVVRFGISESLAGVTFLAFGNGAPDVFSSIATAKSAALQDSSDHDGAVGNNVTAVAPLLGSMVFLTTVVLSLVNLVSKPDRMTRVTPKFFLRDFFFLLAVVIYELVLLLFVGYINIFSTFGFLLIYAAFVIVVIKTNKSEKGNNEFIDDEASKADELLRAASVYKKKQTVGGAGGSIYQISESLNPYKKQLSRRDLDKLKLDDD